MNFLEAGLSLKVVPENIKNIRTGKILKVEENLFSVEIQGNILTFELDEEVELLVNISSGVLKFNSHIVQIDSNILYFYIPEKYSTVQRREYPRININIPVTLQKREEQEEETKTEDISGGGMKIASVYELETGSELIAKLKIANGKNIKTIFKVLRATKDNKNDKEYILSGKFSDIAHSDRTAIIQLCFRKQLEQKFKRMRNE
ncbi:MAG: PilZ domain-containing protein [bacterium]